VPAVVLGDDVEVPEEMWALRFSTTNADGSFDESKKGDRPIFGMPLLHFRDRNIVNPFNYIWFYSAGTRVRQMLENHPEHKVKYNWFLALKKAVSEDRALIPEAVFDKWLDDGKLKLPPLN
jgi:hypothetical protein